jgi:hypothetical protein
MVEAWSRPSASTGSDRVPARAPAPQGPDDTPWAASVAAADRHEDVGLGAEQRGDTGYRTTVIAVCRGRDHHPFTSDGGAQALHRHRLGE